MVEQGRTQPKQPRDSLREALDTVVTVVVVVLLLRTYVAEAFMIPTGSMATTLYGYQKEITCPECGFIFPVNCSTEREPQQNNRRDPIIGCTCPNCRYEINLAPWDREHQCYSGDKVLVAKYLYDFTPPNRLDVVVFKRPGEPGRPDKGPQENYDPVNYIKRLVGLPGETIGISNGNLYRATDIAYKEYPIPDRPEDLWKLEFTNRPEAQEAFREGDHFQIIRKPPDKVMSMRRPVYNHDHRAQDLIRTKYPPRWAAEADSSSGSIADFARLRQEAGEAWKSDGEHAFHHAGGADQLDWLRYRHLVVPGRPILNPDGAVTPENVHPRLITDMLGYNTSRTQFGTEPPPSENWVGDLMLDMELTVDKPEGEFVLELSRGVDRFQARWDLATGKCVLVRFSNDKDEILDEKPTAVKAAGTYHLRFANIDDRLTVWVNRDLPFGEGVEYDAAKEPGPQANDLRPVGIGAKGAAVKVDHLQIWRDVYYTCEPGRPDHNDEVDWSDPHQWDGLRSLRVATFYVHPGHYFCLGDNSPRSSDSRAWGLVPQRLMLGRALVIYYPVWPFTGWSRSRAGAIH